MKKKTRTNEQMVDASDFECSLEEQLGYKCCSANYNIPLFNRSWACFGVTPISQFFEKTFSPGQIKNSLQAYEQIAQVKAAVQGFKRSLSEVSRLTHIYNHPGSMRLLEDLQPAQQIKAIPALLIIRQFIKDFALQPIPADISWMKAGPYSCSGEIFETDAFDLLARAYGFEKNRLSYLMNYLPAICSEIKNWGGLSDYKRSLVFYTADALARVMDSEELFAFMMSHNNQELQAIRSEISRLNGNNFALRLSDEQQFMPADHAKLFIQGFQELTSYQNNYFYEFDNKDWSEYFVHLQQFFQRHYRDWIFNLAARDSTVTTLDLAMDKWVKLEDRNGADEEREYSSDKLLAFHYLSELINKHSAPEKVQTLLGLYWEKYKDFLQLIEDTRRSSLKRHDLFLQLKRASDNQSFQSVMELTRQLGDVGDSQELSWGKVQQVFDVQAEVKAAGYLPDVEEQNDVAEVEAEAVVESTDVEAEPVPHTDEAYYELLEQHGELQGEHEKLKQKTLALENAFNENKHANQQDNGNQARDNLIRILDGSRFTVDDVFRMIQSIYPENIDILPECWESMEPSFPGTRVLLEKMMELAGPAVERHRSGMPLKQVYGGLQNIISIESKTVRRSPQYAKLREFVYRGEKTEFFKHLKIGNGQGACGSIRVHFEFMDNKLVVAYAGEHLPTPTSS